MHQDTPNPNLFLDDVVELLKELSNVLTLMIKQRVDDMLDLHGGVVELVHAKSSCYH